MFSLPQIEEKILKFWKDQDVFKKSLEKKSPRDNFVFYEGPPTANGKPGIHHVLARAFKDAIPRYKTMQGFYVERKAGWDTHGLPVELEVEKKLKLKDKNDVEKYGIEKFNKKCRESVWQYKEDWEKMTERIGFWIDMDYPYITYDNNYIESLWWIISEAHKKNLLYKGHKVIPQCPRCGTALSSHEVAQGYKNVEEESVYLKFKLKTKNEKLKDIDGNIFILTWTTTPWTLPGNVALAVGKDIDYVMVENKENKEKYVLAKALRNKVLGDDNSGSFTIVQDDICGKDLVGLEYEPLFDLDFGKEKILERKGDGKQTVHALVFNKENKLLNGLRKYDDAGEYWMVPGGRSHKGENLRETLKRELQEECNITNYKIKKYLGMKDGVQKGDIVHWFLIELDDYKQIKNGEPEKFKEWKWFEIDEIPENIPHKSDIEYFKQALAWNKAYKVYPANFVSTEDGTGVVHTAVMYGVEDYELGEKIGLPKVHTVNLDGTFNELVPQWKGKFVKDVEKEITADLEKRKLLFAKTPNKHDYPFCWRCDTPLIYYAKDSWYFKMSALRDKLIKNNSKINWVPEHIKEGRFGEWLREVKDWAISRERYWGTPIPIWTCEKCGEMKVIGSVGDLEKLSGKKLKDLHRPYIDKITFKCDKCNGEMQRIPEVMDCWFDSGAMPFAQWHYPFEQNADKRGKNKTLINTEMNIQYPADYISEAIDQTRGWFYTLLAVATILDKPAPYKNVICLGHILDKQGQKMSKSKGNVIDPKQMIDKYGADALRWYLYTINSAGEPKRFDEQGLKESSRMFITLFNVLSFYQMYVEHANNDANKVDHANDFKNVLDKWMAAKLNLLIQEVTKSLDNYDLTTSTRKIEEFVADLSTWYVRRSRERFKSDNSQDKDIAVYVLGKVLFELTKLLAPFAPFTAEYIYSELGKECKCLKESVHLEDWPKVTEKLIDQKVLDYMEITRKVVELGLAKRAEKGIKVRQPLKKLSIINYQLSSEYVDLIKDEVNVKEVEFVKGKESKVELDTKLNSELEQEGLVRELIRAVNAMRKKAGLTRHNKIQIKFEATNKNIKVALESEEFKNQTVTEKVAEGKDLDKIKINDFEVGLKIEKI